MIIIQLLIHKKLPLQKYFFENKIENYEQKYFSIFFGSCCLLMLMAVIAIWAVVYCLSIIITVVSTLCTFIIRHQWLAARNVHNNSSINKTKAEERWSDALKCVKRALKSGFGNLLRAQPLLPHRIHWHDFFARFVFISKFNYESALWHYPRVCRWIFKTTVALRWNVFLLKSRSFMGIVKRDRKEETR